MAAAVPDELTMFDDGVFEIRDSAGVVVGHLATIVEKVWSPFRRHHQVWLLVTWADVHRERIFEDYRPWTTVGELRSGHFDCDGRDFAVTRLDGDERSRAWHLYGIKEPVGAYM